MSTSRWGDRLVRYPDDLARRYRRSGLWGTRTIADELRAVATTHPQREAVVALDGRMTYRELDERTDVLAAGLAGLGLVPGDPVLFQVTNRLGAILAWYGVLKAGLVPVCTLAAHRGHEIADISRRVGAVAHLVEAGTRGFDLIGFATEQRHDHPTLRHILVLGAAGDTAGVAIEALGAGADPWAARKIVEDIQRGIEPDDVAVFQLSGGTTGVPKVIPRLHAEYWYNAAAYARSWGWSPDTRVAHLIPVIHNAGIVCAVHGPHSVGACLVLGTPDLADSLPLMAREGATHVLLGHGHFKAVAESEFAAATVSVTQVVLSGTKVPPDLFDELEQRGLWSGQLFGMGEGLFLTTRPGAPREARATTVGTPLSPWTRSGSSSRAPPPTCPTGKSASCAAAARTRCPATSTRPRTTPGRSRRTASIAPVTWPRSARSAASGTSPSRAGSRTSSTGAARRSMPKRWNCCCCATRGSPTPPPSPCPTPGLVNAPVPTS